MYKGGFVVNVVDEENILNDDNGTAALGFGKEYKIRVKNKNTRDAVAKIKIDGRYVTNKGDLIVKAGHVVDIERFIDSLDEGKKFRFERLENVSPSERDNPSNGIIEISFRLTKEVPIPQIYRECPDWNYQNRFYYTNSGTGPLNKSIVSDGTTLCNNEWSSNASSDLSVNMCCCSNSTSENIMDVSSGKTVEGNYSGQRFEYSYLGELEYKETVIKLNLVGYDKTGETKPKIYCSKCGNQVYTKVSKFCNLCGEKINWK